MEAFYLVLNDGTDAASGTSATLPEGSMVNFSGTDFTVSYFANGDGGAVGNDVALIAVPEPGLAGIAAVALVGLLAKRRRRS